MELVNNLGISPNSRPLNRARQTGANMKPSLPDMLTVSLKDKTAASLSSYISKPATSTCSMMKEKDEKMDSIFTCPDI